MCSVKLGEYFVAPPGLSEEDKYYELGVSSPTLLEIEIYHLKKAQIKPILSRNP